MLNSNNWCWKEGTYDVKGRQGFYAYYWQFEKTTFQIQYTNNQEIIYIQFGNILRIEKVFDTNKKPTIMTNLEQIKHLKWEGNYGINNVQIGKWRALWQGKDLNVGGQFNDNGLKIGKWIELFENYWEYYEEGKKHGTWDTFYEQQKIGGGSYQNGYKIGIWIDLYENFYCSCKVTHQGEYSNGIKIGRWNTIFQNNIIGTTDYDENGFKNGLGIELHEDFYFCCQIIYKGEYKNNIKVGRWDTFYRETNSIIGGGNYDINGQKNGQWIDLHEGFNNYYKFVYSGTYNNGIKQGKFIESQLT